MTATQSNLAAAGCILVSTLLWSTIPLLLTHGVGAAPALFIAINRFAGGATNIGYLLIAYPRLRTNPSAIIRTLYPKGERTAHARVNGVVAVGKLEWVTYIAALSPSQSARRGHDRGNVASGDDNRAGPPQPEHRQVRENRNPDQGGGPSHRGRRSADSNSWGRNRHRWNTGPGSRDGGTDLSHRGWTPRRDRPVGRPGRREGSGRPDSSGL